MFSILYSIFERVKCIFTRNKLPKDNYDFSVPVPKSDKKFWEGLSCELDNGLKCIIHMKTRLLISYEGKLLGRYVDNDIIQVEDLDPKIIQWYKDCGFEIESV